MKAFFNSSPLLTYQARLKRLRVFTLSFYTLLFIPMLLICIYLFQQFEQKQLTKHKKHANKLTEIINKRLFKQSTMTNSISPTEFDYFQYSYNPETQEATRYLSPLADPDNYKRYDGLIGFFQIDAQGRFNSPMWPDIIDPDGVISLTDEKQQTNKLAQSLYDIVMSSEEIRTLMEGTAGKKSQTYEVVKDIEQYFIFYRVVDVSGEQKIQGYVLDRERYLLNLILKIMNDKRPNVALGITIKDTKGQAEKAYIVSEFTKNGETQSTLVDALPKKLTELYLIENKLHWPFKSYCIAFSTKPFSASHIALFGVMLIVILLLIITLGCYGFYLIGKRQLKLAEQRLNFVSSVSHELKTPLTSIRMYSEMLKSGQILTEQHRDDYYEFIFSESERLSRLIENILQLSKLSQPAHNVEPSWVKLSILSDVIMSKVSSLLVKSGFKLDIKHPFEDTENTLLWVDMDAFAQVIINITDNAIKFFDHAKINDTDRQKLDFYFNYSKQRPQEIQLHIRDYGVGVSEEQQDKLFELFYRGGNELTRATQGTGIGLALVKELMSAQQGHVTVERMRPGLALNMVFKCKFADKS